MSTVKILFLCSGNGGNLRFIHESYLEKIPFQDNYLKVVGIVVEKDCKALEYAIEMGLPNFKDNLKSNKVLQFIDDLQPDLIITTVNKILSEDFVENYKNKLINLHYSLLPAFKGMIGLKPIESAVALNCSFIGASCHLVEKEVDSGKILSQSATIKNQSDDLIEEIFQSGCLILVNGILLANGLAISENYFFKNSIISPSIQFNLEKISKIFSNLSK